jgi:DUF1016 N-terminal domain
MTKAKKVASSATKKPIDLVTSNYDSLIGTIRSLVETARHSATRSVNALMTAAYWEIGRRIFEFEQRGEKRAGYGQELLKRLAGDLCGRFGRGFAVDNLQRMRGFYLAWDSEQIYATLSRKSLNAEPPLQISGETQLQSAKSAKATTDDSVTAEEEIKDPFVFEFLDLRDEYSGGGMLCR